MRVPRTLAATPRALLLLLLSISPPLATSPVSVCDAPEGGETALILVERAPAAPPTAIRLIPGSEPARQRPGGAPGSV